MKLMKRLGLTLTVVLLFVVGSYADGQKKSIDLKGEWRFATDAQKEGTRGAWYLKKLEDSILLPGTMDANHKGKVNTDSTTMHLNRKYLYEGAAWYQKDVTIPECWKGCYTELYLERTKNTAVYVDGSYIGGSQVMEAAQRFDLGRYLTPGKHTITICVNNDLGLTPYGNVHINSDDTQTNWNGIIGDIRLDAKSKTRVGKVKVTPLADKNKLSAEVEVINGLNLKSLNVMLEVYRETNGKRVSFGEKSFAATSNIVKAEYSLNGNAALWDEYHQPLYTLRVTVAEKGKPVDEQTVSFGMRKFATSGTHFTINGRNTFLRGKHDACVFPLSGTPPMNVEGWIKVFEIAKSYGINHYRFHTWCPPQAAFEAADRVGMFLQPELPFWKEITSDTLLHKLEARGKAILDAYANHPSFVMFSMGNEIGGNQSWLDTLVSDLKAYDGRPLYVQGSNNCIGYCSPSKYADYHTTARLPYSHDTVLTHVRMSQAFVDSREGGIINYMEPSARVSYDYPVSLIKVPIISHEVGQYQTYPNYKEIDKYTGILDPRNLIKFRDGLKRSGMMDQNEAFTKASGALAVICYKAEIEAALRTTGMGGFQLLDLQDFPGQGTALVGILDAFMDSKGIVTPQEWRQYCNDIVPLLLFDKYCWKNTESFKADIKVANYSDRSLSNDLDWSITNGKGEVIKQGTISKPNIALGGLRDAGAIEVPLENIKSSTALTVTLTIKNSNYRNSYRIWVYPVVRPERVVNDIFMATSKEIAIEHLKKGEKVLLIPAKDSVKQNSVEGLFNPEFWNYGMFKGISEWAKKPYSPGTMGLLINTKNPIFTEFPSDSHSDWQWWNIVKHSRALNLNTTSKDYRPIVQVIDNLEHNNKYGMIMEFKVGSGSLLICMAQLGELKLKPEGIALHNAIIKYMQSADFNPSAAISADELSNLIR